MTATRNTRLVPTGYCFCGCGGEAEIGRWFVQGHDITAAAALRAVEGRRLPHRLVEAGYGPEHSVVQAALEQAGWKRCPGCAYAGAPDGLAAHLRAGSCATGAPAEPEPPAESAVPEPRRQPDAGPEQAVQEAEAAAGAGPGGSEQDGPPAAGGAPAVLAESGAARGRLLPAPDDPSWAAVPLHLRQRLRVPAYQLVSPVKGALAKAESRRLLGAVRAAARMRLTGAHWILLLTAEREALGSPRSQRAGALYEGLEQVAAELAPPAGEQDPAGRPAEGVAAG